MRTLFTSKYSLSLSKDFFYSKNDQGKLIQNIVFEYVDDNLESLIERTVKSKSTLPQRTIKVRILTF